MGGMKGYPFLADKRWCSDRSKACAKTRGAPVLLAHAYLAGICAAERFCTVAPSSSVSARRLLVLALTIPEVRRLLARLIWPASSSVRRVLAWSWWRRCHQSRASYYHTKRRLKAG